MTTLIDAMLEVARLCNGTFRQGTATGGSTTTLIDTAMDEKTGTYQGGTLWALSGTNDGLCTVITSHAQGGTLTIPTLTAAIIAGNEYAVLDNKYPKHKLKTAVLLALRHTRIMGIDTSTTTTANSTAYALPSGVFDVRRIEVSTNTSEPYGYEVLTNWEEKAGYIYLNTDLSSGYKLRLHYVKYHDDIAESGSIDNQVNLELVKWAALINLYTDRMGVVGKDEPILNDLLGNAMAQKALIPMPLLEQKDPKYKEW